jgi:hypothetical protein
MYKLYIFMLKKIEKPDISNIDINKKRAVVEVCSFKKLRDYFCF